MAFLHIVLYQAGRGLCVNVRAAILPSISQQMIKNCFWNYDLKTEYLHSVALKAPKEDKEERQEATANLAVAKEASTDVAEGEVLLEPGGLDTLKEQRTTTLFRFSPKWLWREFSW